MIKDYLFCPYCGDSTSYYIGSKFRKIYCKKSCFNFTFFNENLVYAHFILTLFSIILTKEFSKIIFDDTTSFPINLIDSINLDNLFDSRIKICDKLIDMRNTLKIFS